MPVRWNPFRRRPDSRVESHDVDALRPDLASTDSTAAAVGSASASAGSEPGLRRTGWNWPNPDNRRPGDRRKILIVTPVFTHVYPEAFEHFQRLLIVAATYCPFDFEVFVPARKLLHGAMNEAADIVTQQGFEAMIVMDDDCLPYLWRYDVRACGRHDPRRFQVIPRLLGLWEEKLADVLAGVGYMRGYPHTTTVGRLYPEGMTAITQNHAIQGFYWLDRLDGHANEVDANGLLQADFCGFPIVLIPKYVLEGIKGPAFGTIDDTGGACTHDVYFCKKVREAGFKIRVDTMIDSGHITAAPIVDRFTRPVMQESIARLTKENEARNAERAAAAESLRVARERESDPVVA